ncbi:MAG: exo-alpha-sialidase [Pirellulales bacterium]|nr:exo-alpha-sialidase [Pirellulales bacterium]
MKQITLNGCIVSLIYSIFFIASTEAKAGKLQESISIPTIDISNQKERHSFVARGTPEIYNGHTDTVLLPDGKTMYCAWMINHADRFGSLARSEDGGKTWSKPLEVPKDWYEVRRTTPTLHRLVDPRGVARLFIFAGCDFPGRLRQSYSEDNGRTWTPIKDTGLAAEAPPKSILSFDGGKRLLMWGACCDVTAPGKWLNPTVWISESYDGGLSWTPERNVVRAHSRWSQPSVILSPDGKQLLMLLRNESNLSLYSVSNDQGKTWSEVGELPQALTGHRHKMHYAPDGRLVVVMRDTAPASKTKGNYVAWVGNYDDIVSGREGQYHIKLLHSYAGWDCGYSGLVLLPDGTFVATTYIKYEPGPKKHSVVTTRFKLEETDKMKPME